MKNTPSQSETVDPDRHDDSVVERPAIVHDLIVPENSDGERLDKWLSGCLADLSRARIQAMIADGCLSYEGLTIRDASKRVKQGHRVILNEPAPVDALPIAQDIPLEILYEDEFLIVINKAAGMVVHPAPGNPDGTLVNALLGHCRDALSGIGGVRRPGIVHRLDKDTSGVMLAAKTDIAHQALSEMFAAHDLIRAYKAIVWGVPSPSRGTIEGPIGRHPQNRQKMAVVSRGGKHALTRYALDRSLGTGAASLVTCLLETGRTHQVRVHMALNGHPLIGDPLYGRKTFPKGLSTDQQAVVKSFQRQALHAYRLEFIHPITGAMLQFESALPPDMAALLQALDD